MNVRPRSDAGRGLCTAAFGVVLLTLGAAWAGGGDPPPPASAPGTAIAGLVEPADSPGQAPPPPGREFVASGNPGRPFLRPVDTMFDWGVVEEGQAVHHTFVLHNDGDTEFRIRKARPS